MSYTSSNIKPKVKKVRQCRADRMEQAKRFRSMLASFGLPHPEAAKLLHVSLRTLQNWLSGRHEVPYTAYKLVRLLRYMELPGKEWDGWYFAGGVLVTPEGRTLTGKDGSWWSLLVRQARCFQAAYTRSGQLERALMELAGSSQLPVSLAVTPAGRGSDLASAGAVDAARTAAGGQGGAERRLIYLKNTSRPKQQNKGQPPNPAIKPIATYFTSWKGANNGR